MHPLSRAVLGSLALVASLGASTARPDFTGTWRIIAAQPTSGGTADRLDTWVVTQTVDALELVDGRSPSDRRVYRLDGGPTEIFNILTGHWEYRTLWVGDRLVISAEGEDPTAASTEIWHLDAGDLVIEWHHSPPGGPVRTVVNRYARLP
jgi:hypothetical protein